MNDTQKTAVKVSALTIAANTALALLKLFAGVFAHSRALVSDAIHSASDVFSTLIVIVGVKIAGKKADSSHPYGHERFECIAAMLLSFVLALTGLGVGYDGVKAAFSSQQRAAPSAIALGAALVSVAVKEWMYRFTIKAAKRIGSDALRADAWHHRSDSLSSVGSFAGVLGARLGCTMLDPLASAVISIFILKAAFDIFKDCTDKMTDRACDEQTISAMREVIMGCSGVICITSLRTRQFGSRAYVDVDICADGSLTLFEAHDIALCVHDSIERRFVQVKHCMVHVDPVRITKHIDKKD